MPLSEQEIVRREKLGKIREMGIDPYPAAQYHVDATTASIKSDFEEGKKVVIAGRLMSRRIQGKASFALPESDLVIMKVSQFPPWKSVSDPLRSISSAFWRPLSLLVRCICGRVARPRPRPPELRTPDYFAVLWRVQMTCSMMILREKRS